MRILFISPGNKPDYQCDMLFHGLRHLFGTDVVDVERIWYMYADEFSADPARRAQLYGRGFTLYGLLGPDAGTDRTDIPNKIKAHWFDLIVYGSIHRSQAFLPEVLGAYPPHEILFVDGEDSSTRIFDLVRGLGLYFKREHDGWRDDLIPIQFAIPAEKIANEKIAKTQIMAQLDPRDRTTYIYTDEAAYRRGYATARFGITMKKSGWDCLRHYEIMANDCVPCFIGLELCPPLTMTRLPFAAIRQLNTLLQTRGAGWFDTATGIDAWHTGMDMIGRFLRSTLTTTSLASYVIECQMRAAISRNIQQANRIRGD